MEGIIYLERRWKYITIINVNPFFRNFFFVYINQGSIWWFGGIGEKSQDTYRAQALTHFK